MYYFVVFLFFFLLMASWGATLLGLPGNWIMVALTALFALFFPASEGAGMSWWVVLILMGLATVGEVIEAFAAAAGIARGGSRRGAAFAIVGSIVGSFLGALIGLPIPFIGPFVGVLFFASLGAMVGAWFGEKGTGKSHRESLEIGKAAFWGRLIGSLAKILVGSIMVALATAGALIS